MLQLSSILIKKQWQLIKWMKLAALSDYILNGDINVVMQVTYCSTNVTWRNPVKSLKFTSATVNEQHFPILWILVPGAVQALYRCPGQIFIRLSTGISRQIGLTNFRFVDSTGDFH